MAQLFYMRLLAPFSLCLVICSTLLADVDTSFLGRTFAIPGPNCFSTALRVTGIYPTFRGVDVGEFKSFIESQCKEVQNTEPGDIGTYLTPDGLFLHAFVFLDATTGIEKAGVDYVGKSAVLENSLANIDYIRYADPYCRQYSKNISECSNVRKNYRCTKFTAPISPSHIEHEATVNEVEHLMMVLIDGGAPKSQEAQILKTLELKMSTLNIQVDKLSSEAEDKKSTHYKARQDSLNDQMIFIRNALQN